MRLPTLTDLVTAVRIVAGGTTLIALSILL